MIVRDFGTNGQFSVADWSEEINIIPNSWGTIQQLGLFQEEFVAEHVVQFEEIIRDGALIVDRVRGDRSNVGKDFTRKIHSVSVPHFPMEDVIYPQDIQGKRAYGSATEAETLDAVRARKMVRIAQNHAWTLEAARAQAITAGTAYAPSGSVSGDWYQEFTGTSRPTAIDFLFGTSTTEMLGKIEAMVSAIQDNSGSVSMTGVVVLTSPTFFASLIAHPTVKLAYQYYTSAQSPLRDRLADAGAASSSLAMHRTFIYGGVTFIEMRDKYAGTALLPTNYAYACATGTEYFSTYFSPANKFGIINTIAERLYMFESTAPNGSAYTLETESNHLSILKKPLLVVAATSST